MTKKDTVARLLADRTASPKARGEAFAPANIALCKYWGKRNEELNLPVTSSLSVSLGSFGATTTIIPREEGDVLLLNEQEVPADSPVAERVFAYLDLFRTDSVRHFDVRSTTSIPVGAGLASSAAGFAAMALALNDLFGWQLNKASLSILARLGSGSACRSIHPGFVEWHAGTSEDGMDSYAEALPHAWPEFRLGLLMLSTEEKHLLSRPAMKRTVETSPLYSAWPVKVKSDLEKLRAAIGDKEFPLLGETAESNALTMHATMLAATPPVLYWLPESVAAMERVWQLRESGLQVFFTMDAGPNLKLLFLADDGNDVRGAFPEIAVVAPFQ